MQTMRTGARSIWFELSRATATQFPTLSSSINSNGNKKFDVAVIGAGITGLSTAQSLVDAGVKNIAVIEALQIGKGVTGYSTAKITSQHNLIYADLASKFGEPTSKTYAEMNQSGLEQIVATIQKYNIDCDFSRQPAYTFTQKQEFVDQIKKEAEAAQKAGIPSTYIAETTQTPLPFNILAGVRFENQAQFNSYDYCVGLSLALAQQGVSFFENSRICEVDHVKSPHQLKTHDGGSIEADFVVLATHLPFLDRSGHFGFVQPISSYGVAYRGTKNQKFLDGMYISAEEPKRSIRSAANGTILIVGGCGHPVGEPPGGNNENAIKDIESWTAQNFGSDVEQICHWMAHDYRPPDHLPYIGYLHRGCTTIFCATGFMKWGITLGAAGGRLISDLIVHAKDPSSTNPTSAWAEVVDSRRWDLSKSAPQLAKTGAHVGKHFIGDKVKSVLNPLDIEDLGAGCGGICKTKQHARVAAYREDDGATLHTLSPVCTHLGCDITWNQSDRTWDCPCHGSRFNYDGAVIHGPATSPLKKIEEHS